MRHQIELKEYLNNWQERLKTEQPNDLESFQKILQNLDEYINNSSELTIIQSVFQFVNDLDNKQFSQNFKELLDIYLYKILVKLCRRTQDKVCHSLLSIMISKKLDKHIQNENVLFITLYQSLFLDLISHSKKFSPELLNSFLFMSDFFIQSEKLKQQSQSFQQILQNTCFEQKNNLNLNTIFSNFIKLIKQFMNCSLYDYNFDLIFEQIYNKILQIKNFDIEKQFLEKMEFLIESRKKKGQFDFLKENIMKIKQLTPKLLSDQDYKDQKNSVRQVKKDLKRNKKIVEKQLKDTQKTVNSQKNLLQASQDEKNKVALKKMHSKFDDANKEYKKMQTTQMQHKKNEKRKGTRMAGNKTEKQIKKD